MVCDLFFYFWLCGFARGVSKELSLLLIRRKNGKKRAQSALMNRVAAYEVLGWVDLGYHAHGAVGYESKGSVFLDDGQEHALAGECSNCGRMQLWAMKVEFSKKKTHRSALLTFRYWWWFWGEQDGHEQQRETDSDHGRENERERERESLTMGATCEKTEFRKKKSVES